MNTIFYNCGCSITKSMFGEQEILQVHVCSEHVVTLQKELRSLAEKVANVATDWSKRKK